MKGKDLLGISRLKRRITQVASMILINSHIAGYLNGKIFTGKTKGICVPVLNCYSCPGATGACPIGALQAVVGSSKYKFSFYILGFLMLFGITLGRLICGLFCPFGLLQDLLYKTKLPKVKVPKSIDRPLRYLKYGILIVFVIALPMLITNKYGVGFPYFCKLICPAGTLGAGIPLTLLNPALRSGLGNLFVLKITVLILVILSAILVYRPFCKYFCPLGAFYGLFNKISFHKLEIDRELCIGCNKCVKQCKMEVPVLDDINSAECIRCGECKAVCPTQAINSEHCFKKSKINNKEKTVGQV